MYDALFYMCDICTRTIFTFTRNDAQNDLLNNERLSVLYRSCNDVDNCGISRMCQLHDLVSTGAIIAVSFLTTGC